MNADILPEGVGHICVDQKCAPFTVMDEDYESGLMRPVEVNSINWSFFRPDEGGGVMHSVFGHGPGEAADLEGSTNPMMPAAPGWYTKLLSEAYRLHGKWDTRPQAEQVWRYPE